MSQEQTSQEPPEKPFSTLVTIYFANEEHRQFFRQNSPTGGTYLECWSKGKEFEHRLGTVELGTPAKLALWMREKGMKPSDQEEYESYFFQFCREVEAKRTRKNEERQRQFENK